MNDIGYAKFITITDEDAKNSGLEIFKMEGIIPAIETAHTFAVLDKKQFKPTDIVVIKLSGRGDKDLNLSNAIWFGKILSKM